MTNTNPPDQWSSTPSEGSGTRFDHAPGAPVQPTLAGIGGRLVALIVDSVLLGVVAGILGGLIQVAVHMTGLRVSGIRGSIEFVLGLIYFGWLWSTRGQTLGYMLMRIRLTRTDGGRVGLGRALLRFILIELSFGLFLIPAIVSFFMIILGGRKQAIHDLLVDTVVIRT